MESRKTIPALQRQFQLGISNNDKKAQASIILYKWSVKKKIEISYTAHRNELLSLLAKMLNGSHLTVGGKRQIFESFKTTGMSDFQVFKLSHGPCYCTVMNFILYLRFYNENWSNTDCNNIWCILQNENRIGTNQSVCQASWIWREQCFHFKIFKTTQKSINIFYHANWKYNFQRAHSGSKSVSSCLIGD